MKKKTITGATALGIIVATTPVYAMPVEVNEQVKGLVNPPSTATPAVDPMNVYTSYNEDTEDNSGDGSVNNPYNRFEDAIAQVADGGTIYIKAESFAFLNDVGNKMPFLIDKNVTIKPANNARTATLSVRSAGIVLGADVTFENISLEFANRYHDSIFANGYELNLINVTKGARTRDIDLFVGGLHDASGNPIHPSGNKGVINIETTDSFGGGNSMSKFGNIYAGSMNGVWNGNAEINVSNSSTDGSLKKLEIGEIKASGALETYVGDNFFDQEEPAPPTADATRFPVTGNVEINLHEYQVEVDGTTGGSGSTSVTATSEYTKELKLKNVERLTVASGKIKPVYEESVFTIPNVTVGHGATLDLTNSTEATIGNYDGDGVVVLRKDGKLNITNPMQGSLEFQAEGATYDGESLQVNENHVYITTPNEDAHISFKPHFTQTHLDLVPVKKGDIFEWTAKNPNSEEDSIVELEITGFSITEDSQTMPIDEINGSSTSFPFVIETNRDIRGDEDVYLEDYDIEITVNGKQAVQSDGEYVVDELGLSMFFTSDTLAYEHELVVVGNNVEAERYEIKVSHNGAEFTANLNVTNNDGTLPVNPDNEGWLRADTLGEVAYLWENEVNHENKTVTLKSFKGVKTKTKEVKVEIPRVVEDYKVVLENLNNHAFKGVTHIQIAEGDENTLVGLEAVQLTNGFRQNTDLQYVNLKGLDVSKVTHMDMLFSLCPNLRVINILDWKIKEDANVLGMFFASKHATEDERKLLVLTNSKRFAYYNFGSLDGTFEGDNRIPSMYTFDANGGQFLDVGEDIRYIQIPNFTFHLDKVEELDELFDYYVDTITDPKKDGHAFKGWYTEDKPTSVYDVLNMTYKAEWIKLEDGGDTPEEEQPPTNPDDTPNGGGDENNPGNGEGNTGGGTEGGGSTGGDNTENEGGNENNPDDEGKEDEEEGGDEENGGSEGDDSTDEDEDEEQPETTFYDVIKEIVSDITDITEEVIKNFKDALAAEGMEDVDNTSDEVYTEAIEEIQKDIEDIDSEDKYTTLEAIKELIQRIKDSITNGGDDDNNTEDGGTGDTTPPSNGGGTVTPDQPSNPDTPENPDNNTGGNTPPTTPDNDKPSTPPSNDGSTDNGSGNGSTGGNTGGGTTTPPTVGGGSTGGSGGSGGAGGGSSTPETKPETKPTNGIVNLKDLDKKLQEKVDSIIAETTVTNKQELVLNVTGDKDDMGNIDHVEVTKDGIFAVVDGKKLKFGTAIEGVDLDLNNARVVRIDMKSSKSILDGQTYKAVAHKKTKDGLMISSSDLENLVITSKVAEPFVDVLDTDWFKDSVEEAYNYGFTQGTSLDTYSPKASITRGEFAVMIARALELTSNNTNGFADLKGKFYADEVTALKVAGIINGFEDGTFRGDQTITRQEAAKMLANTLEYVGVNTNTKATTKLVDMDKVAGFAKESVQYLASQGVLIGDENNKFNPTNNLTRAEMAKILVQSLRLTDLY